MAEIENLNQEQEEQSINFRDILSMCIANWMWILLSVVICLCLGVYYYLRTPKIYNRSAVLLIKDDSKTQGMSSDVASMFSNMGLGGAQTNVNNELAALQAPANIMEAGKRLGLDMTYLVKGTFQPVELYGKTLPVKVRFMGLSSDEAASLELTLKADGSFTMTDFNRGGDGRIVEDDKTEVKVEHANVVFTGTWEFSRMNKAVLKDDFSEKKLLSVTTPNGERTFIREYQDEPAQGLASVIYSSDNEKYLVNYFITDHSVDIGSDNRNEDHNNVDIIVEALECSLNKVLAKHSLSIEFEKSSLDHQKKSELIYFNFALGNLSNFK